MAAARWSAAIFFLIATVASAQSTRTFVSAGSGSDSNPCTRPLPCRSFTTAIAATSPGGEVVAIDSGGYGPFTVNKALSVIAPTGVYAGITATSSTGIFVNAAATDLVVLDGLTVVVTDASRAMEISHAAEVVIDHCATSGGTFGVIVFQPIPVSIRHSSFSGASTAGVDVNGLTPATVIIDDCHLSRNASGLISFGSGGTVLISNSLIEGSTAAGVSASSSDAAISTVVIDNCRIAQNGTGVTANSNVTGGYGAIYLSRCTISGSINAGADQQNAAIIYTRGNNTIRANGSDVNGVLMPYTAR